MNRVSGSRSSTDLSEAQQLVEAHRELRSATPLYFHANLVISVVAIFLSNSVNIFTTIYAHPGRPVLFYPCLSYISSLFTAGLRTALAAKKDAIDKADGRRLQRRQNNEVWSYRPAGVPWPTVRVTSSAAATVTAVTRRPTARRRCAWPVGAIRPSPRYTAHSARQQRQAQMTGTSPTCTRHRRRRTARQSDHGARPQRLGDLVSGLEPGGEAEAVRLLGGTRRR